MEIARVADELLDSQEGLCSMDLMTELISYFASLLYPTPNLFSSSP